MQKIPSSAIIPALSINLLIRSKRETRKSTSNCYFWLRPTPNYITRFYTLVLVLGGCSTNYILEKLYVMSENRRRRISQNVETQSKYDRRSFVFNTPTGKELIRPFTHLHTQCSSSGISDMMIMQACGLTSIQPETYDIINTWYIKDALARTTFQAKVTI